MNHPSPYTGDEYAVRIGKVQLAKQSNVHWTAVTMSIVT